MSSPRTPPPFDSEMIPINDHNDLDMFYLQQNQFQMSLESPWHWDQATLSAAIWDTDRSSSPEYFAQDAALAYGISEVLLAGEGNPSSIDSYSVSRDQPPLRSKPPPPDISIPDSPVFKGKGRPGRADTTLRSASTKPKRSTRRRPAASPEEANSRECHNLVEKQYRSRLKAHFEALLAVLPVAQPLGHADQIAAVSPGQCFSRAQVLDAARETIMGLQKENEILTIGRDQLARDLATLEKVLQRQR
ncbi:hypothetical protein MRS44_018103 [Fusarium solani]|uniref:uncharacterized protein n=1 Tax=Fusarium solani TaxID=169388 RepID=UPI0032C49F5A|nr:hypothetical protein MRS44_018103 [Fusarium solani]